MEGLAFLLALLVGAMALVRFYAKKNNTFLFIGTGFFSTALLDGYHAVVTSAFFAPYLPSDLGALIPWSWVASRLFLSALMCMSWLAWLREQASAISIESRTRRRVLGYWAVGGSFQQVLGLIRGKYFRTLGSFRKAGCQVGIRCGPAKFKTWPAHLISRRR